MDQKAFTKLLKTTAKFTNILAQHSIRTPEDLLWYFPRTYEDRTQIKPLSLLQTDNTVQITKGKVVKKSIITTPRGKKLVDIHFIDEEENKGHIQALNGSYLLRSTKNNIRYYIIGKPQIDMGKVAFWHPELVEARDTSDL